jgi:hypothetical protein
MFVRESIWGQVSVRRVGRLATTILIAAALAGAWSPTSAQLAPGRSGTSTTSYMSSSEGLRELQFFGDCFARKNKKDALAVLATRPTSREEAAIFAKIFRIDNQLCMSSGTSVDAPNTYIRGVIAEGWLRSGQPLPESHLLPPAKAASVRNLSDAARCHAEAVPDQVIALIRTPIGSLEEERLVDAAMDGIKACLPPGVQVRNDTSVFRFRLAEGLLRLGRAPSAPVGASK